MTDLTFARPCTYTAPNGEQRSFAPGIHRDIPDEIAGNWFVQAHLVQDGAPSAVPETAPLQHEERLQMKAALDAAEGRAKGAEAERDAAASRAEKAEADLVTERHAHDETKRLLDEATAPDTSDKPDGEYVVKRAHQGKYKVMKGEETVADGLSKADAEAKASEMSAQG